MKLSAKYKRPTVVARLNDEGYIRGSARGVNDSELTSFKDYLSSTGLFEYTQGHNNAFGLSISNKSLDKLHKMANEDLSIYDFGDTYYEVNFERKATDKDIRDIIEDINEYDKIWSQRCAEPLIHITNIRISKNDYTIMGKLKDTCKIVKNGIAYMKFNGKDFIEELNKYDDIELEIVGKANLNEWNGIYTPQIFIDVYTIRDGSLLF